MATSRVIIQLEEVTNTCFVVMPFHALYGAEYEEVIKPAIENTGLTCVRGDEVYSRQVIVQDIWSSIRQARLVVAELSERNPNVMYEIGLAHAIGKPIILLTRNEEDVPFDLRALRYIYYDQNNPSWGADLRAELTRLVIMVLDNPTLAAHLGGIQVETKLPEAPPRPLTPSQPEPSKYDFSGTWNTSWLSIRSGREYKATLAIPSGHGNSFTASMVVTFTRHVQQTIVHETLTGSILEAVLSLTGVNYTYIQHESSPSYSLDSFELRLSDDQKSLVGRVQLRHGVREVIFARQQSPAA